MVPAMHLLPESRTPLMSPSPQEILQQFIEDEDCALARNAQGDFYPSNHHRIKPLVPRAPRLLSSEKRGDFYFHLLRLNECPAITSGNEFDILLTAYSRIIPLFIGNHLRCSLPRPKGLFLFGRDDLGELTEEPSPNLDSYLAHLRFWRYADSFSHMPGMLASQPGFLTLSADRALLERVTKVLARINLNLDVRSPTTLWFWALMLLALQQEISAKTATLWLLETECNAADRPHFVAHLARYLRACSRAELLPLVGQPLNA